MNFPSETETLNMQLARLGYSTSKAGGYAKHIHCDGEIVFTGRHEAVTQWLEDGHPHNSPDQVAERS